MFFSLEGKNTFITGGASGIGREIARRFRAAGAEVVIADLQDGSELAAEIGSHYLPLDVSDSAQVNDVLGTAVDRIGTLHVLINNAGINGADGISIEDSDEALTRKLLEVNTLGVYHGLKHGPAHMCDGGSIINTASLAALIR